VTEFKLQGIPASEGIAIGPAFRLEPEPIHLPDRAPDPPEAEAARFEAAAQIARQGLIELRERVRGQADEATAAIFDAHRLMLDDPMLAEGVRRRLGQGATAEAAVAATTEELAGVLAGMVDERFAARAADVRDVGRWLQRALRGETRLGLEAMRQPAIVVAADLTPSDTASLDPALALGLCTAAGGPTSHTAILARSLGIPAVVGLGETALQSIGMDSRLGLDGGRGFVLVDPTDDSLRRLEAERRRLELRRVDFERAARQPATTADGTRVRVGANIGQPESARAAVQAGAEEIGLLRTEFLYLAASRPPDEETQLAAYQAIAEALEGRSLIIRTLDLGGDKPPSFLPFPHELNPFLGWRAIRVSLDHPELFKTQLRAILRAAHGRRLSVMFPMINDLSELRRAKEMLAGAGEELRREGLAYAEPQQVGVMVETPAAALLADQLAQECDFVSLGTNDLIQYTLAVDRTNERVAGLFQPLHPAVLRSIRTVIDSVHAQRKWAGMCGEMAGMRMAIPLLLGMGLDEFSMVPAAIPQAKWLLGRISVPQAGELAAEAVALTSTEEVEALLGRRLAELES
jgi:phosphoenolpyruvate-protein phosphotransferase